MAIERVARLNPFAWNCISAFQPLAEVKIRAPFRAKGSICGINGVLAALGAFRRAGRRDGSTHETLNTMGAALSVES